MSRLPLKYEDCDPTHPFFLWLLEIPADAACPPQPDSILCATSKRVTVRYTGINAVARCHNFTALLKQTQIPYIMGPYHRGPDSCYQFINLLDVPGRPAALSLANAHNQQLALPGPGPAGEGWMTDSEKPEERLSEWLARNKTVSSPLNTQLPRSHSAREVGGATLMPTY